MAQAVLRELDDETGLEGVGGELVGWAEIIGDDHHFVVLDFAVTLLESRTPITASDAAEAAWVPVDEVARLNLTPGLDRFLHEHGIIASTT